MLGVDALYKLPMNTEVRLCKTVEPNQCFERSTSQEFVEIEYRVELSDLDVETDASNLDEADREISHAESRRWKSHFHNQILPRLENHFGASLVKLQLPGFVVVTGRFGLGFLSGFPQIPDARWQRIVLVWIEANYRGTLGGKPMHFVLLD